MIKKELNEIQARKAEIAGLIDTTEGEQLRALNTELDELNATESDIKARSEARAKAGAAVEKPEQRDTPNEAEKRGRDLMQGRSVTVASTGILMTEHAATTINPTFNEVSSLIDAVRVLNLPGGESFEQPYLAGYGTGDYKTEGLAYATAEPTFGLATISKAKMTAYAEFTEELVKLPSADFAGEVMRGVPLAVRKKITQEILVGDGTTNHMVGIFDNGADAIDAATDIDFAEIDENTLDEIIFSYGGDENVEAPAVLILNKADLKAFALLRDSNGRKIYEVVSRGNTGTINGTPFIINSACKAISAAATTSGDYSMAYGPLSNYLMTIFSPLEVKRSDDFKFSTGVIAYRASIFVGGNVVAKNGFLRVKRT